MDQLQAKRLRLLNFAAFFLMVAVWPALAAYAQDFYLIALALLIVGIATCIDPSVKLLHPKNLAAVLSVVLFAGAIIGFNIWRAGNVVAEATFNPGIAPFDVTVRKVPAPVTDSHHFIITLKRGQYPVTSFRYFWVRYTPKNVRIEWTRMETFKVVFDDRYIATCSWCWGREATWTMQVPPGGQMPGDPL